MRDSSSFSSTPEEIGIWEGHTYFLQPTWTYLQTFNWGDQEPTMMGDLWGLEVTVCAADLAPKPHIPSQQVWKWEPHQDCWIYHPSVCQVLPQLQTENFSTPSRPLILVRSSVLWGLSSSNLPVQDCGLCHKEGEKPSVLLLPWDGGTLSVQWWDCLNGRRKEWHQNYARHLVQLFFMFLKRKAKKATLSTHSSPSVTWEATLSHVHNR